MTARDDSARLARAAAALQLADEAPSSLRPPKPPPILAPSVSPYSAAVEEIKEQSSSQNVNAGEDRVGWGASCDETVLGQEKCSNCQVGLIARDDRPTVDPAKHRSTSGPVHYTKPDQSCRQKLHERAAASEWDDGSTHFLRRKEQKHSDGGKAQCGQCHGRTNNLPGPISSHPYFLSLVRPTPAHHQRRAHGFVPARRLVQAVVSSAHKVGVDGRTPGIDRRVNMWTR